MKSEAAKPARPWWSVASLQGEDQVLLVVTLIIGAVVGLVIVAFILLTENLGSRLYPAGGAAWRRVLVPVIGSVVTGFLLFRYFPNARGSGIPQTKAALFLRDGYISFRTVLGKFGLCSMSLASGMALGREGPSVHVGAGIASSLGRRIGLSPASVKLLVPAGASAALAAAFNTPISAVLFSLEEVMGDLHAPVLGSVVLSSATSWIVLHLLLGDEPLFHVPAYQLVHPVEFVFYAVLGLAGGLVSTVFVKLLLWQRSIFMRAPVSAQWILPGVGGLTVGLLGWFFPEVLGVGYAYVSKALNGQMVAGAMAVLVLLKIIATATCYASGNAGGIFGPSLFIGAMMGGAVGGVVHTLMPDYTGSVGAYALVGMGAAFAGIVRVPLTSVIMVFEITRDYSIVVPLMISNLISYFISSRFQEEPIYEALQHQDGIWLPTGARARESLLTVAHGYRPEAQVLFSSELIQQAAASVDRERGAWPVVDERGFRGMVEWKQLETAVRSGLADARLETIVPDPGHAPSLGEAAFPHVYPDDPIELAMRQLAGGKQKVLPVVSRTNLRELKGTISLADVLAAYAAAGGRAAPATALPARAALPRGVLVGVLGALAGLAVLSGVLNYFYSSVRTQRAEGYFRRGNELVQQERYPEAVEQYRTALSISHTSEFRLALGLALVKADRLNEASTYLNQVLRERPDSGPANASIAEVEAAQGMADEAVLHFQRAVLGNWPGNAAESRAQTRMRLVEFLGSLKRWEQARAELLALVAALPGDPAIQKQAGHMLIEYGLPREAVRLFGQMLKDGPPDSAEYEGLGEAAFRTGDCRAAREAFRSALKLDPSSARAAHRAETCDKVLALDPTLGGIAPAGRYRRSREVLAAVVEDLSSCAPARPQAESLLSAARKLLARKKPRSLADAAGSMNAMAMRLWVERDKLCGHRAQNEVLDRVMAALRGGRALP